MVNRAHNSQKGTLSTKGAKGILTVEMEIIKLPKIIQKRQKCSINSSCIFGQGSDDVIISQENHETIFTPTLHQKDVK